MISSRFSHLALWFERSVTVLGVLVVVSLGLPVAWVMASRLAEVVHR